MIDTRGIQQKLRDAAREAAVERAQSLCMAITDGATRAALVALLFMIKDNK